MEFRIVFYQSVDSSMLNDSLAPPSHIPFQDYSAEIENTFRDHTMEMNK